MLEKLDAIEVPIETTPKELLAFISDISPDPIITFTDDDLPPEGPAHNKPLYITMECQGQQVPYCLVDTGSALNVCTLKTATALGLTIMDFSPSVRSLRAYDNSKRAVLGTVVLQMTVEPWTGPTTFQDRKSVV